MTFPGSPRLLKGAIVGLDPVNPLASVVVFQYNPDTLTRTRPGPRRRRRGDTSLSEALRLKGPPEETIRLDVEVDAADQLERGDAIAGQFGVDPALASLEMLLYPKSALVIANEVLAAVGIIEVIPPEAPLTLLRLGPEARAAGAAHRAHDHRGGLRPGPQPDPGEGRPVAAGPEL